MRNLTSERTKGDRKKTENCQIKNEEIKSINYRVYVSYHLISRDLFDKQPADSVRTAFVSIFFNPSYYTTLDDESSLVDTPRSLE